MRCYGFLLDDTRNSQKLRCQIRFTLSPEHALSANYVVIMYTHRVNEFTVHRSSNAVQGGLAAVAVLCLVRTYYIAVDGCWLIQLLCFMFARK